MTPSPTAAEARPRVAGDRELEILGATLEVLADVGYDRLTMDAVATRAKASKATLYRRWSSKASLVVDAFLSQKGTIPDDIDTGTLRGDLIATYCGMGGIQDAHAVACLGAVITAITRDHEFADEFRERFLKPKIDAGRAVYARAQERGELRDGLDIDLIAPALAGIVLHRIFVLGETPDPAMVTQVLDQVILPAALR